MNTTGEKVGIVTIGEELGEGSFNQVLSIRKITTQSLESRSPSSSSSLLTSKTNSSSSSSSCSSSSSLLLKLIIQEDGHEGEVNDDPESDKKYDCCSECQQEPHKCTCGGTPYVLKRLRADLSVYEKLTALEDLAKEAKILSDLKHPNIIKYYYYFDGVGDSSSTDRNNSCSFPRSHYRENETTMSNTYPFLVLGRCDKSLDYQIALWDRHETISNKLYQEMMVEHQMSISIDISSAMKYLHGKSIIFRDLKPENIGIDSNGVVKLFDFGHARKLNKKNFNNKNDYGCREIIQVGPDEFKLTPNIGTRRYMAWEVAYGKPYGLSSDVYSFSAVLYEIWSLNQIWRNESYHSHAKNVFQKQRRPSIKRSWPNCVRTLLNSCWAHKPSSRPSFEHIHTVLMSSQKKFKICDEMNQILKNRQLNSMSSLKRKNKSNDSVVTVSTASGTSEASNTTINSCIDGVSAEQLRSNVLSGCVRSI